MTIRCLIVTGYEKCSQKPRCDDDDCITLSTSPLSEPTHWKQTIAFLPQAITTLSSDKLTLNTGDSFDCYVLMNQSDDNERFYEIDIGVDLKAERVESHQDDESDADSEDLHPVPCDCGEMRCILIKATLEKYESRK